MRERHSPHVTVRIPARWGRIPIRRRLLTDAVHALTLVSLKNYPEEPAPGSGGLYSPPCSQGVPVTETRDDHVTWLTQEAYDRLKTELDHLSGPGRVEIAKKIEAARDEDEVTFLLASREESGSPIDVYSPRSPLGSAIAGKKVGETATYTMPNGRAATVEILEAVPYGGV